MPFGGITILFSGDFGQLPPVKGQALYKRTELEKNNIKSLNITDKEAKNNAGRSKWLELTHAVFLTEQMRQLADPRFKKLLDRLRNNNGSDEDIKSDFELLKTRIMYNYTEIKEWANATVIVSRNYLREKLNFIMIRLFAKSNNNYST